jgi:hypothetical protein
MHTKGQKEDRAVTTITCIPLPTQARIHEGNLKEDDVDVLWTANIPSPQFQTLSTLGGKTET